MPDNRHQRNQQLRERISYPNDYDVIIHNDDVTTMEFVVSVLRHVFYKSTEDATMLMLDVHQNGSAVAGTYSYDIAASKVSKALTMANEAGFPLRFTIEPTAELPF